MARATQTEAFWRDEFDILPEDEVAIQEYFIQQSAPLTTDELARFVMERRLSGKKKRRTGEKGRKYDPTDRYEIGEELIFPALAGEIGEVVGVREGQNERYNRFQVLQVHLAELNQQREFAAEMEAPPGRMAQQGDEPEMEFEELYERFGRYARDIVEAALEASDSFINLGAAWLPQFMLVKMHEGHANIAEAMIDITSEAMPTAELLKELPITEEAADAIKQFSLNYLLSQDPRFVNVGTETQAVWHLARLR
ncbi:MAG: hypothetical protein H0T73_01705 [Ardenticatenales bacterium]|nr:hypothetical protein [Ardenticatenales bacterium]